ncbi:MAG: hypothetical protein AAFU85_34015 [Planctomycetota bacterium]
MFRPALFLLLLPSFHVQSNAEENSNRLDIHLRLENPESQDKDARIEIARGHIQSTAAHVECQCPKWWCEALESRIRGLWSYELNVRELDIGLVDTRGSRMKVAIDGTVWTTEKPQRGMLTHSAVGADKKHLIVACPRARDLSQLEVHCYVPNSKRPKWRREIAISKPLVSFDNLIGMWEQPTLYLDVKVGAQRVHLFGRGPGKFFAIAMPIDQTQPLSVVLIETQGTIRPHQADEEMIKRNRDAREKDLARAEMYMGLERVTDENSQPQ